ncbi:MAG: hypothetical protein QM758_18175 [Armatimonas sp.]
MTWRQSAGWVGLLLVALSLMVASCRPSAPAPSPSPAVASTFVGDVTCTTCHTKEATTHKASRHANTLRVMTAEALGPLAPALGPIPNTEFLLRKKGNGFAVGAADTDSDLPMDLALGSGKTGMTYVAMVENERMVELRQSYFPPPQKLVHHTRPGKRYR